MPRRKPRAAPQKPTFHAVPAIRISAANSAAPRRAADFVLYWMLMSRRPFWNFGLQRAVEWSTQLDRPLLVLETLICDYPWASDRLHQFIIEAMSDDAAHFQRRGVAHYPFIESAPGQCATLLTALAERACIVVTDEYPCFFLPQYVAAAARKMPVRVEQVDSNGLLPLRATERVFTTAASFRRHFQRVAPQHLLEMPRPDPLARIRLPKPPPLPREILRRWPPARAATLAKPAALIRELPIDHSVGPGLARGGWKAGQRALIDFVSRRLGRYAEDRSQPERDGSSGLSPWLHFGHVSAHEALHAIAAQEEWSPARLSGVGADRPPKATGRREGWWGLSAPAEAFLDELVIWREVGFNFCFHRDDYDQYESLPAWARATLAKHSRDKRKWIYSLSQFEQARTHDPLWNAAQNQLVREGRLHNYMRMLWGKKILEWSPTPQAALAVMVVLNNKYAIDGRDPNSYSGIMWVLGRYDRPWGPERPIFGTVRYMTSESTARKFRVKDYLAKYQ